MPLTKWGQVELRGLLLGEDTVYRVGGFNPFDNTVRADNQQNLSQADGAYSGREYADAKQVPLRVTVDLPLDDDTANFNAYQALLAAFAESDTDLPLRFVWGGRTLRMYGRPRVVAGDTDLLTIGRVRAEAGFVALDPRVYSDAESSVVLALPSDTGGRVLPLTLATTLTATLSVGQATLTNAGNADAPWRATINGPVTNPRLINFTTGQELRIGLVVDSGRHLDLESKTRSVLMDGTASRRGTVSGQWWQLAPGANLVGWLSETGSTSANFTIFFRDAWR